KRSNMSDQMLYEHVINYYNKENYEFAFKILNKIIQQHGAKLEYKNEAKCMQAHCYEFGRSVKKDDKKAFNIYLELSETKTHFTEAKECLKKCVVNQDSKKAFELFLKLSKSDSDQQSSAKLIVAKFYLNRWNVVDQNQKKAVELFLKLSKSESDQQNSTIAKFELAHCYKYGLGITKEVDKPFQLYLDLSKSKSCYQKDTFQWLGRYYLKNDDEMSYKYYLKLFKP
ncbi:18196_t:CDS:2, partial [Cetraspora pellucida]